MKINKIIKTKRKEKNLTQEELANKLGVSTPAVSKWESGVSYPDITLLPPLARILDTDLNTLLSFREDLTREEIGAFVNEIGEIIYKEDFEKGYIMAMEKIKEFPKSYILIYNLALLLEGGLLISDIENKEKIDGYKEEIFNLYNEVLESDNIEIKYQVVQMLSGKYTGEGNFDKAEELLDSLPDISTNKNIFKGSLYKAKKDYNKAYEIYEGELFKSVNNIQTTLLSLIELAAIGEEVERMKLYGDLLSKTMKLYEFSDYSSYVGDFQIAIARKDIDNTLKYLDLLLESMDKTWDIKNSKLYSHIKSKDGSMARMKSMIIKGLKEDSELDFIRDKDRFKKIIEKHS